MRSIIMFLAALALTGCTTTQERLTANNQLAVEPQIYDEMILDNLVDIMINPATLPYFATLDSGIPQVADSAGLSGLISFAPQSLVKQLHNQRGGQVGPISGSRSIQSNWTLKPVNDDNRLRAMRCVYLWVTNHPEMNTTKCQNALTIYYPPDEKDCTSTLPFKDLRQCWIRSGHTKDPNAHYYTRRHLTVYWVDPAFERDFVELGLIIRRIAIHAPRTTVVHNYKYRPDGKLSQQTVITGAVAPKCGETESKKVAAGIQAATRAAVSTTLESVNEVVRENSPRNASGGFEILDTHQKLLALNLPEVVEKYFKDSLENTGRVTTYEQLKEILKNPQFYDDLEIAIDNAILPEGRNDIENKVSERLSLLFPQVADTPPKNLTLQKRTQAAATAAVDQVEVDSALPPDPELTIDNFSNPEISPGLITLPH